MVGLRTTLRIKADTMHEVCETDNRLLSAIGLHRFSFHGFVLALAMSCTPSQHPVLGIAASQSFQYSSGNPAPTHSLPFVEFYSLAVLTKPT